MGFLSALPAEPIVAELRFTLRQEKLTRLIY